MLEENNSELINYLFITRYPSFLRKTIGEGGRPLLPSEWRVVWVILVNLYTVKWWYGHRAIGLRSLTPSTSTSEIFGQTDALGRAKTPNFSDIRS